MVADMIFNGVDMSRFFRITNIIRPVGNKRSISTDDAPSLGLNVQHVKRSAKEHTIKFDMRTLSPQDMETLKHDLASVLNVTNPVKIIYGDEPDKYYLGLPVDDITPDNLTRWFQRMELKLVIPDGVAHSRVYRRYDSRTEGKEASDKITFELVNNGSVDAYPIVTIKQNAESGYIGLVNANRAFEIGNREEKDTENYQKSELLLDYREPNLLNGLKQGQKNVAITNDRSTSLNGSLNSTNMWGREHIQLANRGSFATGTNPGASLTWEIPVDSSGQKGSLNDYIWWRQVYWLGAANQQGFIKVTVSSDKGEFLYGVETIKRGYGLECEYNFLASDGKGGYNILKRWTFTGTHMDTENPFNSPRGWSDLKRNDDKVRVYWWGSYPVFTVPEIRGKKSAKVHVTFGTINAQPLVTHMYLDAIHYTKDFVSATRDIPNRYPAGSNAVINSEDDSVYIDGLAKMGEVVDGSQWLSIPPGKSQLEVYSSSWIKKKPTVTLEFEERWL